jgi:hypothetical protein
MPANFDIPVQQRIAGELITSQLWNEEFDNIYQNFIPAGMDDYSTTDSEMRVQTNPFPASVLSKPTALSGELERLRFMFTLYSGQTYWYQPPLYLGTMNDNIAGAATATDLNNRLEMIVSQIKDLAGTTTNWYDAIPGSVDHFPAGTVMVFYQAAAPTGWTKVTTQNDKVLRVVSGAGGASGGTLAVSTGMTHSHTVNSHSHDSGSLSHYHRLPMFTGPEGGPVTGVIPIVSASPYGFEVYTTPLGSVFGNTSGGGYTPAFVYKSSTPMSSTGSTGAASPATNAQSPVFAYIDIILASKD